MTETPARLSAPRLAPPRFAGTHVVLIIGTLLMVAPYIVELLASVKTLPEITRVPPVILPSEWQFSNYSDTFEIIPLGQQILNSTLITLGRVAGQLLFSSAAAFAFARLDFPGRKLLFALVLGVLMVPSQLFLVPLYQIMDSLRWVDSLQALFVPGMFSPFGVFLMYQFFQTIPKELDEAAKIDGCSPLTIYWRIMLPLVRPGLIALGALTAVWSWNDFLWPLIIINSPANMPVSVGLSLLQGQYETNYPLLMAGAVMTTAPIIAMFAVLQKYFVNGLASSGIK